MTMYETALIYETKDLCAEHVRNYVSDMVHIEIDGRWSVNDFSDFFCAINKINQLLIESCVKRHAYYLYRDDLYRDGVVGDDNALYFKALNRYRELGLYDPLVNRIAYCSPGGTDYTGLGAIAGHIKDIFFAYLPPPEIREEIRKKRIENDEREWGLKRKKEKWEQKRKEQEIGLSDTEQKEIVREEQNIGRLAYSGKISGVKRCKKLQEGR